MEMEDLYKLKKGDKILVECTVEAVFVQSGMVMVTTKDCDKGFDAYVDEIKESNDNSEELIIGICGHFHECDINISQVGIFNNFNEFLEACDQETKKDDKRKFKNKYEFDYYKIPKKYFNKFNEI